MADHDGDRLATDGQVAGGLVVVALIVAATPIYLGLGTALIGVGLFVAGLLVVVALGIASGEKEQGIPMRRTG